MRLLDELRREHDLIERVLGALRTFAAQPRGDAAGAEDARAFVRFFRLYADRYHHAREEDSLFVALAREAHLPSDRGPIAVLHADHVRFRELLAEIERGLTCDDPDAADAERLQAAVTTYCHGLWHHIDAENSVLLPESEARLLRAGVRELPTREPTPEEAEARDAGMALLERHAVASDDDAFRGEACVACPAYGVSCEGIEREWWSEQEWEDFEDRSTSD